MKKIIKKLSPLTSHLSPLRGFTIVELIIYMGILSVLLIVFSEIFVSTLEAQIESHATASVEQDAKYIINRLTHDIQRATSISTPGTLGAAGPTLQMLINGVTYRYTLTGSNIELTNDLGINQLINSTNTTISGLIFKRLGHNISASNTIQVSFTVTSTTIRKGGPEVRNVSTTIGLREN